MSKKNGKIARRKTRKSTLYKGCGPTFATSMKKYWPESEVFMVTVDQSYIDDMKKFFSNFHKSVPSK